MTNAHNNGQLAILRLLDEALDTSLLDGLHSLVVLDAFSDIKVSHAIWALRFINV